MIIPSYITMYKGCRKLKTGTECPKELEPQLQKALEAAKAQAQKLAERLAPYDDEEKVISSCSQYPEFCDEVLQLYREMRKSTPKVVSKKKEKEKDS